MNGKIVVLDLLKNKKNLGFINVLITKEKFDYDKQPLYPEPFPGEVFSKDFVFSPTVVTGLNRPRKDCLNFIKDQLVNIEQGEDCPDELFARWVCKAVDAEPMGIYVKENLGKK